MKQHSHDFIHKYKGVGAFGLDRVSDEETIMFYLQKFSDDSFMKILMNRLSDKELTEIYDFIHIYLKKHLSEKEYHRLFLKESHEGHES